MSFAIDGQREMRGANRLAGQEPGGGWAANNQALVTRMKQRNQAVRRDRPGRNRQNSALLASSGSRRQARDGANWSRLHLLRRRGFRDSRASAP